ncbi:siderophore-interacting protein [Rhizobium sp. XQZ8]|uniref:siderophore-interacting protein n=1 Tax=Rhizobium populisoli TaxID=2859785 RepID=UPI001C67D7BE|nr:siderophore-interacting protein [Rhizobium populisoli]MBW6422131.1 siderophore-interacting protein [Rhizobium populisoli]
MNDLSTSPAAPRIERVRHELKRRSLTVSAVEYVTPQMLRITLVGDDLADFISAAPDDHVKIFLPAAEGEPERRDYTPRRYNNDAKTLVLDFAVHEAGPATQWALDARPGTTLALGGPRGSAVISGIRRWILIGDETALPAIGRRIEEAEAGTSIVSIAAVAGSEEQQVFETRAELETIWVHRPLSRATDESGLIAALEKIALEPETFIWVAAEASVARAVRAYLVEKRGYPLSWIKAAGYWAKGKADAHERIED